MGNTDLITSLEQLLDSAQLAKALRVSVKTIYNLRSRGVLKAERHLGRKPLFDLEKSLARYERSNGASL